MLAQAAYHKAEKPIVSKDGRTRIIIDFFDEASQAYPTTNLENFDPKTSTQHPQVLALVQDYEKKYGFTRESMTTWVGASVTAFLTPQQVERIKADRNVRLLTEDRYATFSSPPLSVWDPQWSVPSWNGPAWGELQDWGHKAVNGRVTTAATQRKVYIIDSGVAFHDDLPSMQRVNVACGTGGDCSTVPGPDPVVGAIGYYAQVGCYAHATHVAGIIGATVNNSKNRMGVYPGVQMVSVGLLTNDLVGLPSSSWCGAGDPTWSAIGAAFDYIYWNNFPSSSGQWPVNIATMSINFVGVGFVYSVAETNRSKLMKMVTPAQVVTQWTGTVNYPGVFFVQSAGNQNREACCENGNGPAGSSGSTAAVFTISPGATSTAVDGIMVVGAVNQRESMSPHLQLWSHGGSTSSTRRSCPEKPVQTMAHAWISGLQATSSTRRGAKTRARHSETLPTRACRPVDFGLAKIPHKRQIPPQFKAGNGSRARRWPPPMWQRLRPTWLISMGSLPPSPSKTSSLTTVRTTASTIRLAPR